MSPQKKNIAGLNVLCVEENPEWPSIILCHGYGASAGDLFPLHHELATAGAFNWYFPEGPIDVPLMPGYVGKAWFHLNLAELDSHLRNRDFEYLYNAHFKGMDAAREKLQVFIEELKVDSSKLWVGGFSQGAMLATHWALQQQKSIRGLLLLSGALVDKKLWSEKVLPHAGMHCFQSHGTQDAVLPVEGARALRDLLEGAQVTVDYHEFRGGHEIPPKIIQALSDFLG